MARLTATAWEQARAEYEVRGISLGEVAKAFGVDRAAVSRRAKKEGWIQGKSHALVERKVAAIKALAEADTESHALPVTFQHTVETVVQERLKADGLLATLDATLAHKAIELAHKTKSVTEWETLTRGRRNLAPVLQPQTGGTTVMVNQQAQAGIQAPSPRESLAEVVAQAREVSAEDDADTAEATDA